MTTFVLSLAAFIQAELDMQLQTWEKYLSMNRCTTDAATDLLPHR